MRDYSALDGLRIGCVPYLNARPLIRGIEENVDFAVPSLLADHFTAGRYDVAMLPVFETLRQPGALVVDGVSISCLGAAHSVILVHRRPLADLREIVLDPASRTSSNLLHILLAERFRLTPRFTAKSEDPLAARLIIGDPAMEFQRNRPPGWPVLDLGSAWHEWTSLPFVFAVWTIRADAPSPEKIASELRGVAAAGLAARNAIAACAPEPPAALAYLTRAIRYSLDAEDKQGLEHFRKYLESRLLLMPGAGPVFV